MPIASVDNNIYRRRLKMANLDLNNRQIYFDSPKNREFISAPNWWKLMQPVNDKILLPLIAKYQSDKWVKTLFTQKILSLYIFIGLAIGKTLSLRLIETISQSSFAQCFTGLSGGVSRSGLSDRNESIPPNLFRDLLFYLVDQSGKAGKKLMKQADNNIKIFDSTFISLAHKLIPWACQSSTKGLVSVTLRIDDGSWLPDRIIIKNEPSDHQVFEDLIDWSQKGVTYLFDRGFSDFAIFKKIVDSGNFLITRLPHGYICQVKQNLCVSPAENNAIKIISDQIVLVGGKYRKKFEARLITAVSATGETLYFLTNRFDLTSTEVADIYRHRWQIETLFKWLKSQLKINRVIAHTENGFYIQIYIALILHILIILYRQRYRLTEYSLLEIYRALQSSTYDSWGALMYIAGLLSTHNSPSKQQKGVSAYA